MDQGPFAILSIVVSIFICFILLMAFSNPLQMIGNQLEQSGNQTSPSVGENMTIWKENSFKIYSIIFATIMIGGAIMLFLGFAIKRRRPPYEEYERYGGDYNY